MCVCVCECVYVCSILRQAHSLFQSQFSTEGGLLFALSSASKSKEVKLTLEEAMKDQMVSRSIALLFL